VYAFLQVVSFIDLAGHEKYLCTIDTALVDRLYVSLSSLWLEPSLFGFRVTNTVSCFPVYGLGQTKNTDIRSVQGLTRGIQSL